jgi:hypothetical protein
MHPDASYFLINFNCQGESAAIQWVNLICLYKSKLDLDEGSERLKSRTLDSEINRNQTRNQEIAGEISEF